MIVRGRSIASHLAGIRLLQKRSAHQFALSGPNPKTSILLTNLSEDLTSESLKASVSSIKEVIGSTLQPGCSLHYSNVKDAENVVEQIKSLNLHVILHCG